MKDLPDKTLAKLEQEFENPHLEKNKNHADGGKPKAFEIIYIQSGLKHRGPISKNDFEILISRIESKIGKLSLARKFDQLKEIKFLWCGWYQERGLFGCENSETVNFLMETVNSTTLVGKNIRGWRKGEYGKENKQKK